MPRTRNAMYISQVEDLAVALSNADHRLHGTVLYQAHTKLLEACRSGALHAAATGSISRNLLVTESDGGTSVVSVGVKTIERWLDHCLEELKRYEYLLSLNSAPYEGAYTSFLAWGLNMRQATGTMRKQLKALLKIIDSADKHTSVAIDVVDVVFEQGRHITSGLQRGMYGSETGHTLWTVPQAVSCICKYTKVYNQGEQVSTSLSTSQQHVSESTAKQIIAELIEGGILTSVEVAGEPHIGLKRIIEAERKVMAVMKARAKHQPMPIGQCKFELSDAQLAWAEQTFRSGYKLYPGTGYAGTGKTVVTSAVLSGALTHGMSVLPLAPTGKAARVLQTALEANGVDTAGLEGGRVRTVDSGIWTRGLDPDYIVIDESSMMSSGKLGAVLERWPNADIVMLGDPQQLPPIETGYPFRDLISYAKVDPMTVVRRTADAEVAQAFKRVRNGVLDKGLFLHRIPVDRDLREKAGELSAKAVIKLVEVCIKKGLDEDGAPKALMMAKTNKLVNAINDLALSVAAHGATCDPAQILKAQNVIAQYYNKPSLVDEDYLTTKVFADGTPVVWDDERMDIRVSQPGKVSKYMIYRGYTGVVRDGAVVISAMDAETGQYMTQYLDPLQYASSLKAGWCMTIHKAQGSSYDAAVVFMRPLVFKNEVGNWEGGWEGSHLYTALTRARRKALIISFAKYDTQDVDWDKDHRKTLISTMIGSGEM